MGSIQEDLSIFNKFEFERPPVGVKFLITKPEGIERIGKPLNICEMLPEAHKGKPFYATEKDITCVSPLYLGMRDDPVAETGSLGPKFGMYKEKRANERLYRFIGRLPKGSAKYVVFAPLDKLSFDPDVFIVTANPSQAEILLRATTYSTGGIWCGRTSSGAGCNFVYVYPYISGEVNFTITGLGFGLGLPDGLILISIPYNLLPTTIDSLREIDWHALKDLPIPEIKRMYNKAHKEVLAQLAEKP